MNHLNRAICSNVKPTCCKDYKKDQMMIRDWETRMTKAGEVNRWVTQRIKTVLAYNDNRLTKNTCRDCTPTCNQWFAHYRAISAKPFNESTNKWNACKRRYPVNKRTEMCKYLAADYWQQRKNYYNGRYSYYNQKAVCNKVKPNCCKKIKRDSRLFVAL